jgi:CTP:molybdopterin cytidylyltransferase MocA
MSTLYTDEAEIMDVAISFTEQADMIYALGTIATLTEMERSATESIADHERRLASVDARKRAYVSATLNRILGGCKYRRVMDLLPEAGDENERLEIVANIRFFLRAFDTPRTKAIDLELYHNQDTMKGRGDFHFRCSNRQLVLRVGGHGNGYANAAIQINDTRVIDEFRRYFDSIVASPNSRRVSYEDLAQLVTLLDRRDIEGAKKFLEFGTLSPSAATDVGASAQTAPHERRVLARSHDDVGATAVVLAAGRGTRMGRTGVLRQKCMLDVCGKPLLAWTLNALSEQGVKRILVLTGYRADDVVDYLATVRYAADVHSVLVSGPSTASAVHEVKERLGEHFWFVHGNLLVPPAVLTKVADRYRTYASSTGQYPAAVLATVHSGANLTHAILRKGKRGEVQVVRAERWAGQLDAVQPRSDTDVLSLGVGLVNKECVEWQRASGDGLMVEGLIDRTDSHPILSIHASAFAHIETDADYRRWAKDTAGVRSLMGQGQ